MWREHDGFGCPVQAGVQFRVRIRAVSEEHANKGPWYSDPRSWKWKWDHNDPAPGDIIAYQLREAKS